MINHPKQARPAHRLVALLIALSLMATACGGSGDATEQGAQDAASAAETTVEEVEDSQVESEPTVAPEPAPTATPLPTPTPEPLNVLTLADAKAGVAGVNWIVHFAGEEPWEVFEAPDGELVEVNFWTLEHVRSLLVVSGTPDDQWVEILLPWVEPNGQTAWVRTADGEMISSDMVLELVRSTGQLNVWQAGEVIWSASDLTGREGHEKHTPLEVGFVDGFHDFAPPRPHFHEMVMGLGVTLLNLDRDNSGLLGIRGVDEPKDGEVSEAAHEAAAAQALGGTSVWIASAELDELAALLKPGSRVEIVE